MFFCEYIIIMTCLLMFYRNYFAFVAKESGKFYCHVFLETEVGTFRCSDPLPKFTLVFFPSRLMQELL